MASPAKRPHSDAEPVVGYLHTVSPVKTSRKNVRYFDATIQTGQEEYRRVVCFSPDKRASFIQATDNKQPVKVVAAQKSISGSNPGMFDVLVSSSSRLEAADNLPFACREPQIIEKRTVAEVLALGPRQRVGFIDARLLQATASRVVPVNGVPCEVKVYDICDPTGQTSLSLWEQQILSAKEGQSYRFQALATRKEGDRTVLTSTPSTVMTAIGEVGKPPTLTVSTKREHEVRGEVTGVQILARPRCRRCHASQDSVAPRCTTHRCERCGILQRANSYHYTYSGLLIVAGGRGEESSMTLTNSAVFNYIGDNFLSTHAHDGPALEEQVLAQGDLEVTVDEEGLVVRFGPAAPPGPAVPCGEEEEEDDDVGGLEAVSPPGPAAMSGAADLPGPGREKENVGELEAVFAASDDIDS